MTADEKLKGIKTFCLFRKAEIEAESPYQAEPVDIEINGHLALIPISMVAEHETIRRILDRCK